MEENKEIDQSNDQSFAVILVIGSLLISSIYFLISGLNSEEKDLTEDPMETLGDSTLSIPEAPSKPVEVPKPQPTQEPEIKKKEPVEDTPPEMEIDDIPNDIESEIEKEEEKKESKPEVKLINTDYKGEDLDKDDPVFLYAEATSEDYNIKKIEYYLNGDKKTTVNKRDMRTKNTKEGDDDDLDEAYDKAKEYIIDEYEVDDGDIDYDFRQYFEKDGGSCDIKKGYLLIIHTDEKFYEIRVSEDFDDIAECTKGKSINYYDVYAYIFTGDKDDYEVYAKAYDTKSNTNKTDVIKFKLE